VNSLPILPNLATSQSQKDAGTIEPKAKVAGSAVAANQLHGPKPANKKSFADELGNSSKVAQAPKAAPARKPLVDQKTSSEKPAGLSNVSDKSRKTLVAPPATAAAPATEAKENTSKQELVNAIRKIVGRDEQAIKNHPELALLTGHLEQLQPGSIPDLVSGSAFLQEALASGDVGKFLAEPMAASEFLKLLNVDTDAFASKLPPTVDFSQMVTPIGVLKAINVDPQIVASELKMLSDNLHLTDGLSSYMARAAKMQGMIGAQVVPQQQPQFGNPLANGVQISTPEVTTAEKMKADKYKALVEALGVKALPADLLVSDENESALSNGMVPTNPAMGGDSSRMNQYAAAGLNPAAAAASQQNAAPAQHTQKVMAPISAAPALVAPAMTAPVIPTAPAAAFDPYSAMISKLSNVQTEKTTFEGDVAKTTSLAPRAQSLEEQLMNSRISTPGFAMDAKPVNVATPTLPAPEMGTAATTVPEMKVSEKVFEPSEGEVGELIKPTEMFSAPMDNLGLANENGGKAISDAAPMEKLSLEKLVAAVGEKSSSTSQEHSQDMSGESKNENLDLGVGAVQQGKQGATAAKAGATSFADSLADKAMSNVKQDIINNSQMMLKNGGGSLILDLGSKEFGKLEVALDIKNNNIDIKILTGSEQMRDLLQQELPKLRDSLTSQNLNLKGVEVGVGNGNAWQQASQQQTPQQGFQNQQAERAWQQVQGSKNSGYQINKAFNSNWQAPAAANHRGQIQVWA
jgi:flagellar hook-length control protein FliK